MNWCLVSHFLHIPCPGCGLTTSIIELLQGHVRQSVATHPLGIIVAVWVVLCCLRLHAHVSLRVREVLGVSFVVVLFLRWGLQLVHL
ncbi:MAG: DUF2752 domain-containing protein [Deltaproteobacteria bacterium]|nr:DUF2752 domain-containing protein [Deltaproteobacteria bacterium]